ncbi:autotransporter domain-containing protein [Phycisphaerales bacterium AB-hyl4]|uniref:Autotransporter domain-containing protein n=1 Tax=Natronomicrosphaera hydrolytica TaxID=3242702 RepID=A0ABV4UA84_9BACT
MPTLVRRWLAVVPALVLITLLGQTRAHADLVPYLDIIGWTDIESDGRFGAMTRSGGAMQGLAVFDTGIDPLHSIFANGSGGTRVIGGYNSAPGGLAPIATPDTHWADGHMHGTFVAALAAGNPFTTGILTQSLTLDGQTFAAGTEVEFGGVARGANILSLRVLGNAGFGYDHNILQGLEWVIENHEEFDIRVLNLSLGGGGPYDDENEVPGFLVPDIIDAIATLRALDIPVVIAAGNEAFDDGLSFPAIIENAISVGASVRNTTDLSEELIADFSNYSDALDLFAPGVDNVGAMPRRFVGDAADQWDVGDGTSYAAPLVAGAVLLINEVYQDYWGRRPTFDEIYDALIETNVFIEDDGQTISVPRLNLAMALEHAVTQGGTQNIDDIAVWTGEGDGTWSDPNNWYDGAPSAGDQLMFTGIDTDTAENNIAGLNIAGIIFATSAEAFTLFGNTVTINNDGEIRNQSPLVQTIELSINAAGDLTLRANAGTLQIDGDIDLVGNGTLTFTGRHLANIDGAISGGGNLLVDGEGMLTLAGNNTYTGGTQIQQGILYSINNALPGSGAVNITGSDDTGLAIGDDETIGSLAGVAGSTVAIYNNTLTIGGSASTTFAGSIVGNAGSLILDGSTQLQFTGQSNYTGDTELRNNTTLVLSGHDNNLSNHTRLVIHENATLQLNDNDETIAALRDGTGGPGGTVQLNDNRLALSGSANSLFTGQINGTGGLDFMGTSGTTHNLANATANYTGTTRIFGGNVHMPDDSVPGDLENYATFYMDGTVAGDVLNAGRYGGNATINGNLTNHSGGIVAPGQSIGTITINGNYEGLANSTLEIELEGAGFEGGTLADTDADRLVLNAAGGEPGEATFHNNSIIYFREADGGDSVEQDNIFLIVEAEGGITLDDNVWFRSWSRFVRLNPYEFNNGDNMLIVSAATRDFFADLASDADHNTRQIARALDSLVEFDRDDPLLNALVDLFDSVGFALEQDAFLSAAPSIGPQAYEAGAPVVFDNTSMNHSALGRHHSARRLGVPNTANMARNNDAPFESALASAADSPWLFRETLDRRDERVAPRRDWRRFDEEPDEDWSVFAYAMRGQQDQDTTNSRLGYDATSYGFLTGFDYQLFNNFYAGLAVGYTRTEIDLDARRGEQEIGSLRVGPQISYSPMPWFIDAAATYGYHRFETERNMPALGLTTESKHNGHDLSAFVRGGYQFSFNRFHLTPTASAEYLYLREDGYTESGVGALDVDSRSSDSLRTRVGLTLDYRFDVNNVQFVPELAGGWEREHLSTSGTMRARFVSGGDSFTINVAERDDDVFYYSAGLGVLFDRHLSGYLRYDGRRYSDGDAYGLTLGASVRF